MFSTHVAILAHGERIAQVLHSFDAIKPRLRVGVSSPFDAAQDRQPVRFERISARASDWLKPRSRILAG